MSDTMIILGILIGVPIYLYILIRWLFGAAARSIYEVKKEFERK